MSEDSEKIILSNHFNDPDELEAIVNRQQEFHLIPLDQHPLQVDLVRLTLKEGIFEFRYIKNSLRVWGDKRSDYLVFEFILSPILGNYLSHGFTLKEDILYGFDINRGIDLVLPANLLMGTLFIKQEIFENYLQMMDRNDLDDRFFAKNYTQSSTNFGILKDYLKELYGLMTQKPSFLNRSQIRNAILEDYVPLMIDAIPAKQNRTQKPPKFVKRSRLVREAEEYMIANLDKPITLKDICNVLQISKTPLSYGFQQILGVSPLHYLKILRLNAVHRVLKTADPKTTKIANIAHQYGFWHLGRFSQYYKEMFGKLPSETLNNH